jgi:hypothetical protein
MLAESPLVVYWGAFANIALDFIGIVTAYQLQQYLIHQLVFICSSKSNNEYTKNDRV